MRHERLGLFDTPPDRSEVRIGLAIVGLILLTVLAALPAHDVHVGPIPGFIPTTTAILLVCDLITAAILYSQAAVFRSRGLNVLASGYLLSGLLFIPYSLTYPGAFSPDGFLGAGVNTTGWIAVAWRTATPTAIVFYALLKRTETTDGPVAEQPPAPIAYGMAGAVALAVLVTLLATLGHDMLPPFFIDRSEAIRPVLVAVNCLSILLTLAGMITLARQEKSVLDVWLLVALCAWLGQSSLNLLVHSRFSLGAYVFFALTLVSNLVVMLALITESNRLYARLALSTAARSRERDTRLMSMDAVAATIAHEVGQPLTAARLSTTAGLRWLESQTPDRKKATAALRAAVEANERTFEVIKSIRSSFAKDAGSTREFGLNELIRETTGLLDREMEASRVSLELDLDESIPVIIGNRVQLQRVLINLLTNALESLVTTKRKTRLVKIITSHESERLRVDVSDSGSGISQDKLAQIFEPFFTTKSTGTGLGLSLSRTIVDEHGGRLWASSNGDRGVTFHIELPRPRTVEG